MTNREKVIAYRTRVLKNNLNKIQHLKKILPKTLYHIRISEETEALVQVARYNTESIRFHYLATSWNQSTYKKWRTKETEEKGTYPLGGFVLDTARVVPEIDLPIYVGYIWTSARLGKFIKKGYSKQC